MALKKQIIENIRLVGEQPFDAYIRIVAISGTKERLTFNVDFLTDDCRELIKSEAFDFSPSLDGKNFIAQAYDYLKTLSKFAGAIDC